MIPRLLPLSLCAVLAACASVPAPADPAALERDVAAAETAAN